MSPLKRPKQPMPDMVRNALEDENLASAYDERPAYQRNDYLWWINSAKKAETKQRRLTRMLQELKAGRGYMGMDWTPKA